MTIPNQVPADLPGTFIMEELQKRGWDQNDLAFIIDKTPQELNKVLKGHVSVNAKWANLFSAAFNVPAVFFLNLQAAYDLHQQSAKPEPSVEIRAKWFNQFPIRDMIKRGWIENTDADLLGEQMRRFFGVSQVSDIPDFRTDLYGHAARKTSYDTITPSQQVWLSRVRSIARSTTAPSYSKQKLVEALPAIRAHMFDLDDLGAIPELLHDCGVLTVFVEALPGAMIDGVCTWIDDQPVIGLSLRQNRPDNLCFVIRHEIEHVLRGDGKTASQTHIDVFEPGRNTQKLPQQEVIADAAAAEFLIPQDKLTSFIDRKGQWISEKDVLAFSARHQIHPSIVVGQIQHRRHKDGDEKAFAWLRKYLKDKVNERFASWPLYDGWGHPIPLKL